jgi:hypothetical protein
MHWHEICLWLFSIFQIKKKMQMLNYSKCGAKLKILKFPAKSCVIFRAILLTTKITSKMLGFDQCDLSC